MRFLPRLKAVGFLARFSMKYEYVYLMHFRALSEDKKQLNDTAHGLLGVFRTYNDAFVHLVREYAHLKSTLLSETGPCGIDGHYYIDYNREMDIKSRFPDFALARIVIKPKTITEEKYDRSYYRVYTIGIKKVHFGQSLFTGLATGKEMGMLQGCLVGKSDWENYGN